MPLNLSFMCVLEIKLDSSCFYSEHIIDLTVSLSLLS